MTVRRAGLAHHALGSRLNRLVTRYRSRLLRRLRTTLGSSTTFRRRPLGQKPFRLLDVDQTVRRHRQMAGLLPDRDRLARYAFAFCERSLRFS